MRDWVGDGYMGWKEFFKIFWAYFAGAIDAGSASMVFWIGML